MRLFQVGPVKQTTIVGLPIVELIITLRNFLPHHTMSVVVVVDHYNEAKLGKNVEDEAPVEAPTHQLLILVLAHLVARPVLDLAVAVLLVVPPPPGHILQHPPPTAIPHAHLAALVHQPLAGTRRGRSVHCQATYHYPTEVTPMRRKL